MASLQDRTLEMVRAAVQGDTEYAALQDVIEAGFPEHRHDLEPRLRAYWPCRKMLAVDDGLIVYGPRLLIPQSLRRETLERLHDGHQGIDRTIRRARLTTYWPGIDRDIANMVSLCAQCRPLLPSQQNEPLWQDGDQPSRVFESVSADYFHVVGRTYLVYVDRMSGWPYVSACPRPASADHLVRASPDGRSPAQILFGNPIRSALPVHHRSFAPEWQRAADEYDLKAEHLRHQVKQRHDATP